MFLLIEYSGIHPGEPVSTCLLPDLLDVFTDELERKYKLILSTQKVARWEGMGVPHLLGSVTHWKHSSAQPLPLQERRFLFRRPTSPSVAYSSTSHLCLHPHTLLAFNLWWDNHVDIFKHWFKFCARLASILSRSGNPFHGDSLTLPLRNAYKWERSSFIPFFIHAFISQVSLFIKT